MSHAPASSAGLPFRRLIGCLRPKSPGSTVHNRALTLAASKRFS
eukprot:CAMPEP_0206159144 /NCGR_PEP_ID=MMETSP1474-20131121/5523_1 /ASSEMBLY_ACC=CAM_ASM_001110 /TAXON_ID=97495 /ORGANISM="Imantonia sp., Strain RCC918" /LENGTH=43 /DNA_ID= /DNA_START= /DNA_END= /DNA_ORIENTATION=